LRSRVFFGIASGFILPVCANYIFSKFPPSTHGRAMGGLIGCLFLGQFINPFVLSPINAAVGIASGFVLVGALNALGAFVAVAGSRYWRRPPEVGEG
jgi:MFS family permease